MYRYAIILNCLLISENVVAETFRIEGRKEAIEITRAEKMVEGRAIMFDVYLKYQNPDNLNDGTTHFVVNCFNKTGSLINEHGSDQKIQDVKIDRNKIKTSTVNFIWFKYCNSASGMSKRDLKSFKEND